MPEEPNKEYGATVVGIAVLGLLIVGIIAGVLGIASAAYRQSGIESAALLGVSALAFGILIKTTLGR